MKYAALLLALLLCGCATSREPGRVPAPSLTWELNGPMPDSHTQSLRLRVDGKRYEVIAKPLAQYQQLTPEEFASYRIPPKALLAAYSWHAGFGDIVYVVRDGGKLEIYRQEMDESETPDHYPVKKIFVIPL